MTSVRRKRAVMAALGIAGWALLLAAFLAVMEQRACGQEAVRQVSAGPLAGGATNAGLDLVAGLELSLRVPVSRRLSLSADARVLPWYQKHGPGQQLALHSELRVWSGRLFASGGLTAARAWFLGTSSAVARPTLGGGWSSGRLELQARWEAPDCSKYGASKFHGSLAAWKCEGRWCVGLRPSVEAFRYEHLGQRRAGSATAVSLHLGRRF